MRPLLFFLFVFMGLGLRAEAQNGRACTAFNARENTSRALKLGVDYVPLTADDSLGFYVAYSPHPERTNTSCMFVLPLQGREALIFGTGYGSFGDAAGDALLVDSIFRQCMGRRAVKVRVVVF